MPKEKNKDNQLMEKIVSLSKRRGFVFPGSEIYGGLANSWDFGPYGVELKNNIKQDWWKTFVHDRGDMVGLDASIIMNPKVWEASGHTGSGFADPLVECKKCHERYRSDQVDLSQACPNCGAKGEFTVPKQFNILMKTFLGAVEGEKSLVYLRGETAQGIFVNFKNIIDTTRQKLPFGVAQIGKAFRNEITPGNYIFRTREFEQMEIEYFFDPDADKWEDKFEMWLEAFRQWIKKIGVDTSKIFEHDIEKDELAHYSKKTVDVEFDFPFGRKELFGLAYRTDFDLKNHKLKYENVTPHVIEPSLGVERMMLAILLSSYAEEEVKGETRSVMKFPKAIAPVKVAVFPLLRNKPELVDKSREIFARLQPLWMCEFDDNGNVGKRYRRQDEIGTPYCVTVDFDTLKDGTVTVRDRDTMKQDRIKISELENYLEERLKQ